MEVKHPQPPTGFSPPSPGVTSSQLLPEVTELGGHGIWSWGALTASLAKDRKCKLTLIRDHPCGLRYISLNQTLATVNFFFHPRPKSCKHEDRNKSLKQDLAHIYGKHTKL